MKNRNALHRLPRRVAGRWALALVSALLLLAVTLVVLPGTSSAHAAASTGSSLTATVFSDDFESDTVGSAPAGWTMDSGTTWSVQAGNGGQVLAQTSSSTSTLYDVYAGSPNWTDYTLSASVMPGAGSTTADTSVVAIDGRRQDVNNFYTLLIKNSSLWYLGKKVNGTWTTLATGSYYYKTTTWYTFTLSMIGSTISASINGVTAATVTDTSFASGNIALTTRNQTEYDNIVVSTPAHATQLTYTGDATQTYNNQTTLSAILTDSTSNAPIANQTIHFGLGSQTCDGTTNATGTASCSITPNEQAGDYARTATFDGTSQYFASTDNGTFTVAPEATAAHITNSTLVGVTGGNATLAAQLKKDDTTPLAGRTLTLTLGSQSCATAATDANGNASCTVSGLNNTTDLGPQAEHASFGGDTYYQASSDTRNVVAFAYLDKGAFVVGDTSAAAGGSQTFWDARWATNSLSLGSAPNSFKGYAPTTAAPLACRTTWSIDLGLSTTPPAGPLPTYMAVIVASGSGKSGSTISGDVAHIVVIQVDAGYAPDPGHSGTGTIVGQVC